MKTSENIVLSNGESRKRVCLTCDLKDDTQLIDAYKKYHSPETHWKEIAQGISDAHIALMDIYLVDNRMFMICEVAADMDFDTCWDKMGTYDRMDEWGALMAQFQQAVPGHPVEWVKMERVFTLPNSH